MPLPVSGKMLTRKDTSMCDISSDNRTTVCIITNSLAINGGNNHVLHLLRLFKDNCEFSVCALSEGPMREVFEKLGVETFLYSKNTVPDFTRFNLVVGNTLLTAHVLLQAHRQGIPYALVLHENWPPENFQKFIDAFEFSDRISVECMRAAFTNATHILLPTQSLIKLYAPLLPATAQVSQVNNICPLRDILTYQRQTSKKDVRKQLSLADDTIVFLQLGTVGPRKNQLTTLKAFFKLKQRRPDVEMHLIIKGFRRLRKSEQTYAEEIENFVKQNDLTACVSLLDVAQEEPYPYLLASDIMVLPSYNELLPQAFMEAGAFSMPAISSDMESIREIIQHGVNGFLTSPDDIDGITAYMEQLATDAKLRKDMGKAFHEIVLQTRSEESLIQGYMPILCPENCS